MSPSKLHQKLQGCQPMQSELPDTTEGSTWSEQDQEGGQQTADTTTRSRSNPSSITSQTVTREGVREYVTSVAGSPVSDEDAEQFINDLEEWYDKLP
jgi:hypothetical protein